MTPAAEPLPGVSLPPAEVAGRIPTLRTEGTAALRALSDAQLLAAWQSSVSELLDPSSSTRLAIDPYLVRASGLSAAGLRAALEVVLGGAEGAAARRLFAHACPSTAAGVTLVILASNLPGLGVQTLLPALARRRPLILKSPSAETRFHATLHRLILAALPELAPALVTTAWRGGDLEIERVIFPQVDRIVLYGNAETVGDVVERTTGIVQSLGPRISFAVVSKECDAEDVAPGIARDTALFDQRGCLSLHSIYTDGEPTRLAVALERSLRDIAVSLPPGPPSTAEAAAVNRLRLESAMRGLELHLLDLAQGTIVVESRPELAASPGLRTVRIHPMAQLHRLPRLLEPQRDLLQGVALAGEAAWALRPALESLGANRFAQPGELQNADVCWCNGGIDPLELVAPD